MVTLDTIDWTSRRNPVAVVDVPTDEQDEIRTSVANYVIHALEFAPEAIDEMYERLDALILKDDWTALTNQEVKDSLEVLNKEIQETARTDAALIAARDTLFDTWERMNPS